MRPGPNGASRQQLQVPLLLNGVARPPATRIVNLNALHCREVKEEFPVCYNVAYCYSYDDCRVKGQMRNNVDMVYGASKNITCTLSYGMLRLFSRS